MVRWVRVHRHIHIAFARRSHNATVYNMQRARHHELIFELF